MDDLLVGLIADTHGTIRKAALDAFAGCDLIVHAGDVGRSAVLEALRRTAPVFAVRGNMDKGHWGEKLPKTQVVPVGEVFLYVLHDLAELQLNPAAAGFAVVVSGHTHRPAVARRNGVLFVNPGSAGPGRYGLPPSVALLRAEGSNVSTRIVDLNQPGNREGG
jgi:putative phosphoesterase